MTTAPSLLVVDDDLQGMVYPRKVTPALISLALTAFDRSFTREVGGVTRFYDLRLEQTRQTTMFDDVPSTWGLIVTRGRLASKRSPIKRIERFSKLDAMLERWGQLCARRKQRGYTEKQGR